MIKEFSAGGIVYKKQKPTTKNQRAMTLWLVCQHSQHKGWVFPKGFIGDHIDGESEKDTALREVKEVSLSFGGNCFARGVTVTEGTGAATFQLLDYKIE